jgi:serine/threonine-protein kinase
MGDQPKGTLAYGERAPRRAPALDETMAAPATSAASTPSPRGPSSTGAPVAGAGASTARSTVLPRVEGGGGVRRVVVAGKPRYETLEALGSGGQAEVTLARDHDIDRAVALKRLLPERTDEASVLRFAEEIRAVGQLEHPNIVPIHDVGVDEEGRYFFVMKYVDGETLEHIIDKLRAGDAEYMRRYTPEYRLQICNEILRGVEHAHALGIVHRDLKPANVMVGPLGEVVIMDWGLAKKLGEPEPKPIAAEPSGDERARLFQTQVGALLGTPAYMAPEQAEGRLEAIDARSDVYSLSVMFYEFFCLRHPRESVKTVAEMLMSVIHKPIGKGQVLSDFLPSGMPAAAAHFVRHGLEHDPALRYATVEAMRERLESIRDGHAPIECPCTFTARVLDGTSHALNRRPYLMIGLLGLTTLLTGAGVASIIHALIR